MNYVINPKFQLGRILITPGAIDALAKSQENPKIFLERHQSGDWGDDLCSEDKALNDQAIANEGNPELQQRVLSAYKTGLQKIWIITEWDRSSSCILLPDEY